MQKKNELVSIIIPAFNTEKYIEECINSVINQTYKNIEVIIIDDGSIDNTASIVNELSKKDKRIKLYSQKNSGVNIARKKGVELSNGEYVMFLDSDDWIDNNTIEVLIDKAIKNKADIIKFSMIYEPSKQIRNITNRKEIFIQKERYTLLYEMILKTYKLNSICATLIKKQILDSHFKSLNVSLLFAEDFMINIDILNNSNNMLLLNEPFYHYRLNQESTTKKRDVKKILSNAENAFEAYSELKKHSEQWNLNKSDIEYRIFKEICIELAKLVLCQDTNKKQIIKYITDLFNKIDLFNNISNLTKQELKNNLKEMNIKDKLQYRLYLKSIYLKKYNLAISSLTLFKTKNYLKNIKSNNK